MWPGSCSPNLQPFFPVSLKVLNACFWGGKNTISKNRNKNKTKNLNQKKKKHRQSQRAKNLFHFAQNVPTYKSWHKPPSWTYCTAFSILLTDLETFSCTWALPAPEPLPRKNNFLVSFLSLTVTFQASQSLAQEMLL